MSSFTLSAICGSMLQIFSGLILPLDRLKAQARVSNVSIVEKREKTK